MGFDELAELAGWIETNSATEASDKLEETSERISKLLEGYEYQFSNAHQTKVRNAS